MRIAIVLTCFNRKEKTKCCMDFLVKEQKKKSNVKFEVFVTDDGSTDGTIEMLRGYSDILDLIILKGKNLYWDKGMYRSMRYAVKTPHDFYLMINDDVYFADDFLDVMLDSYYEVGSTCGISGATQDSCHKRTTYGGILFNGKTFLDPNGKPQECNLANWNCFLIDQKVIDKVGIIDPNYDHSFGDYDYSMLMQRNGIKVYLSKEYIGVCNRNSKKGTFKDNTLTRKQRINRFFSPKGMPFKSGLRYSIKNLDFLGFKGLVMFLGSYLRNLIVVLIG